MEVFVVRLWPGDPAIRGKVEHAASGTSRVFDTGEDLLRLLAEQLIEARAITAEPDVTLVPEPDVAIAAEPDVPLV